MLDAENCNSKTSFQDYTSRMDILYTESNKRMKQENEDLKKDKFAYLDKIEELSIQLRAFGDEIKVLRVHVSQNEVKDPAESRVAELEAEMAFLSKF